VSCVKCGGDKHLVALSGAIGWWCWDCYFGLWGFILR
jgi:hypothetical protein